jgi:glycosyltransferase involved in cell wall biosynthesis
VIVPCRNEAGNIAPAVARIPDLGAHTEIIFVDGDSTDGTREAIEAEIDRHRGKKDIKLVLQRPATGKGDAVRLGFDAASGDVLVILDADLTVEPEDLPKFYEAIVRRRGDLVSGSRLVYPMERQAMRFLNLLGNKAFSTLFTWILEQRITDTLCGTKGLRRSDYLKIKANRAFFGDFDPFGDFDLLFGAAKLNLKIVELPVRYRQRVYGTTKISRFRHGVLLLRMSWIAIRKLKLD